MFEFLLTALTVLFVVILLSVALSFGFFLLIWFIGAAVAFWAYILLRNVARRMLFLYRGRSFFPEPPPVKAPPSNPSNIIEAEFEELPRKR